MTDNNTDTRTTEMENNTLLTGLQELFTSAVKAEVARHVEVNGNGTAIDQEKMHEAVAVALSNQDSDTYPCMDDVTRMVEGNFDEWFTNCMSEVNITDHVDLDDMVQSAVNDIDLSDAISDQLEYHDYPNESRVVEMISESASSGMSLYDANEMLKQVARGGDCNEGDDFRAAVTSIVTAMQANTGGSVDDGTAMSVKVTGTEREIQAILERRRSYFESLHNAISALMGSAPNGSIPPTPGDGSNAADNWRDSQQRKMIVPDDLSVVNARLWEVASAATNLLGLLSGLYHGETGQRSVRIAQQWEVVLNDYKAKIAVSANA